MISDTIEVSITYARRLTFFLRMLSISEEQDYRQRIFGLDEKERAEKEYGANVAILKELSEKMPEGMFSNRPSRIGKETDSEYKSRLLTFDEPFIENFDNPAEAIERFFHEKTNLKERIAYFAVRAYFIKLAPSESFF